jgi:hypothetical protein
MTIELEPIDKGPRSIFELGILTQLPDIVDDLLNTSHKSERDILELIEDRGFRVGEGSPIDIPQELTSTLRGFGLKRHSIIDEEGRVVATIGILKGDENKLEELNAIIKEWEISKGNKA